jgi:hypothetical protein
VPDFLRPRVEANAGPQPGPVAEAQPKTGPEPGQVMPEDLPSWLTEEEPPAAEPVQTPEPVSAPAEKPDLSNLGINFEDINLDDYTLEQIRKAIDIEKNLLKLGSNFFDRPHLESLFKLLKRKEQQENTQKPSENGQTGGEHSGPNLAGAERVEDAAGF